MRKEIGGRKEEERNELLKNKHFIDENIYRFNYHGELHKHVLGKGKKKSNLILSFATLLTTAVICYGLRYKTGQFSRLCPSFACLAYFMIYSKSFNVFGCFGHYLDIEEASNYF